MENSKELKHRAGFVNIIGRPNVGKSTLLNALIGERLSAITSKAQTTRHRILGMLNGDDYQIVFSDTPGHIAHPINPLHKAMNVFVEGALEDADILLFVTDKYEDYADDDEFVIKMQKSEGQKIVVLNKVDMYRPDEAIDLVNYWKEKLGIENVILISAKEKVGIELLIEKIKELLPICPPYYDKEALTDKPEKFFVSEIIREKIFLNYDKEIPYSTEVVIEEFKEGDKIVRIRAIIFVERESQKPIIIGRNGEKLKKVGTEARLAMEEFLQQKVFLETQVKVKENWRSDESALKGWGYKG